MSAEIISLAEFRARRAAAAPALDDALAIGLDRASFAAASRALAASIEAVRQQAATLHAARARHAPKRPGAGSRPRR